MRDAKYDDFMKIKSDGDSESLLKTCLIKLGKDKTRNINDGIIGNLSFKELITAIVVALNEIDYCRFELGEPENANK